MNAPPISATRVLLACALLLAGFAAAAAQRRAGALAPGADAGWPNARRAIRRARVAWVI
jgi:hypothetical protein